MVCFPTGRSPDFDSDLVPRSRGRPEAIHLAGRPCCEHPAANTLRLLTDVGITDLDQLGELMFHRGDLAPLAGEKVTITDDQALAVIDHIFPASVAFFDKDVAKTCNSTIHIKLTGTKLRSGTEWSIRVSPLKALVTGKVRGYGPKPALAIRSQNLFTGI